MEETQYTITVPDLIDRKQYLGMNPQDQEGYASKKIGEVLRLNGESGVTIPDILETTPFSRPTVLKYLEQSVSSRSAYKIKRRNLTYYYPNGKIAHPELSIKKKSDDTGLELRATFLNNNFGEYLYIEDVSDKVSGGGMLINLRDLAFFKEFISEAIKKGEKL
jgi:hypothetical protein